MRYQLFPVQPQTKVCPRQAKYARQFTSKNCMQQSNPATRRIDQRARLFSPKTFSAVAIVAVVLCLLILSLTVRAQSGRKAPPAAKPSPGQSSTAAPTPDQDEQTASNGKIA